MHFDSLADVSIVKPALNWQFTYPYNTATLGPKSEPNETEWFHFCQKSMGLNGAYLWQCYNASPTIRAELSKTGSTRCLLKFTDEKSQRPSKDQIMAE